MMPLQVQPVISYPREVEPGKMYLMTIDFRMPNDEWSWPYLREEFPVYCMIDSGDLFVTKPIGEPVVILHCFGNTYGPARFLLTAKNPTVLGSIHITLTNQWGLPLELITLENIKVIQNGGSATALPDIKIPLPVIESDQKEASQELPRSHDPIAGQRTWPFLPLQALTPEQREQWWSSCFVSTPVIDHFLKMKRETLLVGGPGSGKSTAIVALQQAFTERVFFINYMIQHWPKRNHPLLPDRGHIGQIMTLAANVILQYLEENAQPFAALHPFQEEFLYWLIETHVGRRALQRLGYQLQRQGIEKDIPAQVADLYPFDERKNNVFDVQLQVNELSDLVKSLGFDRIIVLIDLDEIEAHENSNELYTLLEWLSQVDSPEFFLKAAVPNTIIQRKFLDRIISRLSVMHLEMDEEILGAIIGRHLQIATNGQLINLADLATETVIDQARHIIYELYNSQAIGGWLGWVETLIYLYDKLPVKSQVSDPDEATFQFFQRHVPLRLDSKQQGVWRGPQFLALDRQPYELLVKLFALRGQPSPEALLALAGSSANLNTSAARLRRIIEPLKDKRRPVYLMNRRDQGYWLENFLF